MNNIPEKIKRVNIKDGKLLYHLTPLENLESIIRNGLKPRSNLDKEKFIDTANSDIINKRSKMKLTDYVPFHFISNGPYDGSVRKAYPDKDFAYICVSREVIKNDCKIIVGHPLNIPVLNSMILGGLKINDLIDRDSNKLYDWDKGFDKINWELMEERNYTDEACKQMCMSEALYPETITHENIQSIWIPSSEVNKFEKIKKELNGKFYIDAKDFLMAENSKNKNE
ncbi:TPA: DUF4433 domain-containing protein [Campylobacter lari]|uniref:DUF4433 domain-containing protein n=1 Tax=Campylobacter sp. IFREMER_LSEM_CL1890 TaxID=2911615 RepID=UPI0021E62A06|nr:DUF4433 domain-containing protein [Campylobacter sp. IFREMER_LSEM_CL1890]MCV3409499.1 DUF4433 domain-containing protein [Campylobacter sp. IFREMER_LSEM_CL1890]HEC1797817.1 DUF4433 domain-containing protein [Campylobacter lari]